MVYRKNTKFTLLHYFEQKRIQTYCYRYRYCLRLDYLYPWCLFHTFIYIFHSYSGYFKGHVLVYGQSILYTWDDPTKDHELICAVIETDESQTKLTLDKVIQSSIYDSKMLDLKLKCVAYGRSQNNY